MDNGKWLADRGNGSYKMRFSGIMTDLDGLSGVRSQCIPNHRRKLPAITAERWHLPQNIPTTPPCAHFVCRWLLVLPAFP